MGVTVTVKQEVEWKRIKDLLCCALEGGSGYWAQINNRDGIHLAPGLAYADFREDGKMQEPDNYFHPYEIIPTVEGCSIELFDATGEADSVPEHPQPWILNRESLERGLQVMADKYPHHYANFVQENEDAETGDVYLQCCVLGEIVFG